MKCSSAAIWAMSGLFLATSCSPEEASASGKPSLTPKQQYLQRQREMIQEAKVAPIAAHVPPPRDFERMMDRDVRSFFADRGKDAEIVYETLGSLPAVTTDGRPIYYLWVQIAPASGIIERGAARLEARDRNRFIVTDYLTLAELKRRPESLKMFPPESLRRLKRRMGD